MQVSENKSTNLHPHKANSSKQIASIPSSKILNDNGKVRIATSSYLIEQKRSNSNKLEGEEKETKAEKNRLSEWGDVVSKMKEGEFGSNVFSLNSKGSRKEEGKESVDFDIFEDVGGERMEESFGKFGDVEKSGLSYKSVDKSKESNKEQNGLDVFQNVDDINESIISKEQRREEKEKDQVNFSQFNDPDKSKHDKSHLSRDKEQINFSQFNDPSVHNTHLQSSMCTKSQQNNSSILNFSDFPDQVFSSNLAQSIAFNQPLSFSKFGQLNPISHFNSNAQKSSFFPQQLSSQLIKQPSKKSQTFLPIVIQQSKCPILNNKSLSNSHFQQNQQFGFSQFQKVQNKSYEKSAFVEKIPEPSPSLEKVNSPQSSPKSPTHSSHQTIVPKLNLQPQKSSQFISPVLSTIIPVTSRPSSLHAQQLFQTQLKSKQLLQKQTLPQAQIIIKQKPQSPKNAELIQQIAQLSQILPQNIEQLSKTIAEVKNRNQQIVTEFNSVKTKIYLYLSDILKTQAKHEYAEKKTLNERYKFLEQALSMLNSIYEYVTVKQKQLKDQKLRQFKSPLALNEALKQNILPPFNPQVSAEIHPSLNTLPLKYTPKQLKQRYEKYKSFYIGEKHADSTSYSLLFRQFPLQTKTIYKNPYIELTSKYTIIQNGEKNKMVKITLRLTNISDILLTQISAKPSQDPSLIAKPSQISIMKLPPNQFLIQQLFLSKYSIVASKETNPPNAISYNICYWVDKRDKRRISAPLARDIWKFVDIIEHCEEDRVFNENWEEQRIEAKTAIASFDSALIGNPQTCQKQEIAIFKLVNRSAFYYLKVERGKEKVDVTIRSAESEKEYLKRMCEYLEFLYN